MVDLASLWSKFLSFLLLVVVTIVPGGLRRDIVNTAVDYLDPMVGIRLMNYSFTDITTEQDLDNNTLRYLLALRVTPYAQTIYLFMNIVNSSTTFEIMQSM